MKRISSLVCMLAVGFTMSVQAQEGQPGSEVDPIEGAFFPPELIMAHQDAIGITDEQRKSIIKNVQETQAIFTTHQWTLHAAMDRMGSLTHKTPVDEQAVLAQLTAILDVEREIKLLQVGLMVRIKNMLTEQQQAQLREIRQRMQRRKQR
jgi:Spy/CpxP family protein refolding chaperone